MAAASVAVTSAEHDVRVQLRFAILQRDVADERQNLHLRTAMRSSRSL